MKGTTKNKDGVTTHRCTRCGHRFEGTGKRGRPFRQCPPCRDTVEANAAWEAGKLLKEARS